MRWWSARWSTRYWPNLRIRQRRWRWRTPRSVPSRAARKSTTKPASAPPEAEPRPTPTAPGVRDWALHADRTAEGIRKAADRLRQEHPDIAAERVVNEHGDDELLSVLMDRRARDLDPQTPSDDADDRGSRRRKRMFALFRDLGYDGPANQQQRRTIAGRVTGRDVTSMSSVTAEETEADRLRLGGPETAAPPADGSSMTLKPTTEQQQVIDAFQSADRPTIVVQAGAGCGKSSTLKMAARTQPNRKGLYVAYNKALAVEARGDFPAAVTAAPPIPSRLVRSAGTTATGSTAPGYPPTRSPRSSASTALSRSPANCTADPGHSGAADYGPGQPVPQLRRPRTGSAPRAPRRRILPEPTTGHSLSTSCRTPARRGMTFNCPPVAD
nr:hypothetical protein [Salinispora arenicola]